MPTLARDHTSTGFASATPGTTLSWSHTCAGGADNVLLVGVKIVAQSGDPGAGTVTCTFNSVSMTQVGVKNQGGGGAFHEAIYAFGLAAPSSGAHVIAIAVTGLADPWAVIGLAVSYTGAAGTFDTPTTGTAASATDFSLSQTPPQTNEWVTFIPANDTGQCAAGTNSTELVSLTNGLGLYDSNGAVTAGAAFTMHATFGSAVRWDGIIVSIPATDSVAVGSSSPSASVSPSASLSPSASVSPSASASGVGESLGEPLAVEFAVAVAESIVVCVAVPVRLALAVRVGESERLVSPSSSNSPSPSPSPGNSPSLSPSSSPSRSVSPSASLSPSSSPSRSTSPSVSPSSSTSASPSPSPAAGDADVTVLPEAAIEIRPDDLVVQGPNEARVYMFDWDRENLASGVTIDASVFTITAIRPPSNTALVKDNEDILAADRKTWLRLSVGTLGAIYRISNRITTNESPAQTKELSFFLKIEYR
jgi:hypothetical protein